MATDPNTATLTDLAKRAERSLTGKFRATVEDNNDPEKRGRLKLKIPSVFNQEVTDWVPGAFALGGIATEALMMIPANKSHVLVEFIEGDRSSPIWTATYFPQKGAAVAPPEEFDLQQGQLHLLRTRKGIMVRLEDDGESNQVIVIAHPGGGEARIDKDGIVTLKDQGGAGLTLDPQAKVASLKGHGDGVLTIEDGKTSLSHGSTKIELGPSGITATAPQVALDGDSVTLGKGAASPVLDGQAFASLFDGHVHPSSGAITTMPLAAALMGVVLKKVKGA